MPQPKFHYGWAVTAACGVMLFYSVGLTVNSFSVFLTPLIESVGLTKTQGSTVSGFQGFGSIASMLICGPLFTRFGARRMACAAGLTIAIGFFAFSLADSLAACCAASFVTGVGYGSGSMISVSILMTAWFEERRGTALGLASAGSGVGTILFPPILAWIVRQEGLAAGFRCVAASIAVLTLLSFFVIRDTPAEMGLEPYGAGAGVKPDAEPESGPALTIRQALRTREFLLMAPALLLIGCSVLPTLHHLSTFYTSEGHTPAFAATMISVYGLVMLGSKPLYGWVIDRFGILISNTYIMTLWLAAAILGMFVGGRAAAPYMFAILLGAGVPMCGMGMPIWCGALFGKNNMAKIFPLFYFAYTIGGLLSMPLPGFIADTTGKYIDFFPFLIAAAVIIYCLIQYAFIRKRRNFAKLP